MIATCLLFCVIYLIGTCFSFSFLEFCGQPTVRGLCCVFRNFNRSAPSCCTQCSSCTSTSCLCTQEPDLNKTDKLHSLYIIMCIYLLGFFVSVWVSCILLLNYLRSVIFKTENVINLPTLSTYIVHVSNDITFVMLII